MGAGASATQMVFFIASVIIALSVVGAIFINIQSLSTAVIIGSKTLTEQLKTDITVINDPEIIPNSSNIYTFYVKNTGVQELDTKYINVIIDGTMISDTDLNKTVIGGSQTTWLTGDVLMINATVSLDPGSHNHNLRIIAANGIEDTFPFRT